MPMSNKPKPGTVWMAGSREAVAHGAYSFGPAVSRMFIQSYMNDADILVCKNAKGKVLIALDGADNFKPYKGAVQ